LVFAPVRGWDAKVRSVCISSLTVKRIIDSFISSSWSLAALVVVPSRTFIYSHQVSRWFLFVNIPSSAAILTVKVRPKRVANAVRITRPFTPAAPTQSIRLPVAFIDQATLDVIAIVRARPVRSSSLVFLASGRLDADSLASPLARGFTARAAAVKRCKGENRKGKEENRGLHVVLLAVNDA
jgi:hypothetical protein